MLSKTNFMFFVVFCMTLQLIPLEANAQTHTNVRGKVVFYNNYAAKYTPLPNQQVTLNRYDYNLQQLVQIKSTYTDPFGFFYMYDVPIGSYELHVSGTVVKINVQKIDPKVQQFQDISQIIVR